MFWGGAGGVWVRIACARSHPLPGTTPPLAAHQWEPVSCWWGTGRLGELGGGAGEPRTAPPRRRGANQHLGGHQPKLGSVLLETLGPRFIQPQGSARRPTFPLRLQVNCLQRYSQINYRVIYRSAPSTPRFLCPAAHGGSLISSQQDGCWGPRSPRGGRHPVPVPIPARGTRSSRRRPRPHGTTESELLFPTTTAPAPWKRRGDGGTVGTAGRGAATGRRRPATGCPGPPRARACTRCTA